jgi:hypothetical protein
VEARHDFITIRLAPEHTSTMDVDFRGSAVALGASLFNAKVAAAAHHVLGPVSLAEGVGGALLQATLQLRESDDPELAALYKPMLARETSRRLGTPRLIPADTADLLQSAAEREGARLHLLTRRDDIARAATILAAADRIRYLTPRLHEDIVSELRWPGDRCPDTGIDVGSLELDPGDLAVLDILRRPDVMAYLDRWNAGTALGEDTRRRVLASSGIAVISVAGGTLSDHARGGSAMEAVWIAAQLRGLAVQPVSPVFLYARNVDELSGLSTSFGDELGELHRSSSNSPAYHGRVSLRLCCDSPSAARLRCGAVAASTE